MTAFLAAAAVALQSALGLGAALRLVDDGYPKLRAVREEVASAVAKAQEKRGAFDPAVFAGLEAQRYNSPTDPGKPSAFGAASGGVSFFSEDGLSLTFGSRLNGGKPKSPLNSTGDLGEHSVTLRVPLLRDLGLNEKSAALRQARLAVPLAERQVEGFRLAVLRDAAGVYWEWVAAIDRLRIARELLTLATFREDATRRRFEAGDEREMSVVEAQAETERRAGGVAKAERDRQKAALKLTLFLGDGAEAAALLRAAPAFPQVPSLGDAQVAAAAARALARRPEIAALDQGRRIVDVDLEIARNARRAGLDLTFGIGVDAGGGGIGPTPRLGLVYSVPLRQNAADGRAADAQAKLRKLDAERELLVRTVRIEVEDAASAVRTALDRLAAARRELAFARRLEAMERTAFDLGEGTLFLVNLRERAAGEAAGRVVDALTDVFQADAALRAASADF